MEGLSSECWINIVGGQFSTVMGRNILLPFGQGSYDHVPDVDRPGYTKIVMQSSGTNEMYEHPWNYIVKADHAINYGYYSHFRAYFSAKNWSKHVVQIKVPKTIQVIGNPQRELFEND